MLADADVKGPDRAYTAWENIETQIPPDREDKETYARLAPDGIFEPSEPVTAPDTLAVAIGDEMPNFTFNAQAVFAAARLRRSR